MFTYNELFNFGQNFQANTFGFTSQVHIVLVLFSLSLPRVVSGDTPYLIYYRSSFVSHLRSLVCETYAVALNLAG